MVLRVVAVLGLVACGGSSGAGHNTTTTNVAKSSDPGKGERRCANFTPDGGRVPDIASSADNKTSVQYTSMCCPTKNQKAMKLYDDAVQSVEERDFDTAMKGFEDALAIDADFCDAMDNLGIIKRAKGDINGAIALYRRSLAVVPTNATALMDLAVALTMIGRPAEAALQYQKIIAVEPENPEGHFGLGKIHSDAKQWAEALPHFEKALELYEEQGSPYVGDGHFYVGIVNAGLGKYDVARQHLEQAQQMGVGAADDALARLPKP